MNNLDEEIEIVNLESKLEKAYHNLAEEQKTLGVLQNRIDRVLFYLNQDCEDADSTILYTKPGLGELNYKTYQLEGLIDILLGKQDETS